MTHPAHIMINLNLPPVTGVSVREFRVGTECVRKEEAMVLIHNPAGKSELKYLRLVYYIKQSTFQTNDLSTNKNIPRVPFRHWAEESSDCRLLVGSLVQSLPAVV